MWGAREGRRHRSKTEVAVAQRSDSAPDALEENSDRETGKLQGQ